MNEEEIKKVYQCVSGHYIIKNNTMGQFNETLAIQKFNNLVKNVHTSWCSHLIKDKDKN